MRGIRPGSLALIEREVDGDFEELAVAEAGGEGVDLVDSIGGFEDGVVHNAVAGGIDDLALENVAILRDADLELGHEFLGRADDRGRLLPFAIEALVNHAEVPSELRRAAARAGSFAGRAGAFASARRA